MAVRVLLPSEPSPSPSSASSRSPKRQRLYGPAAVILQESITPCEEGNDVQDTDDNVRKSSSQVTCAECGEQFMFAAKLVVHSQQTQHRPFACEHEGCKKKYSKREHLTRHIQTVHVRGSTQSVQERKPFTCELCGGRFAYSHGLTRHLKNSHQNASLPFECTECLKGFKKKSELQAHSYVHTGVLPFGCQDCGERFLKRFWLNRHQRTHEANKEADTQVYVCGCGEICFDKDELTNHKKTEHSSGNEKGEGGVNDDSVKMDTPTHVCLVCDQSFTRMQYLRAHLRTHFESLDDRKQYTCPMDGCNKAYTRKSNLMTHYNAVHDERKSKRFACPREGCTARFGYKKVLKHHIESMHDNPKPPKRRECKSAGILERALGLNQVGEHERADKEAISIVVDEEDEGAA
ncbi:hypothetical protein V7S43_013220 [Phytophthora oleae]|uniref:C2H2-type domain-containing protein n=1 Tax=Phytophthora oleae TaxID=2107226 RepID=A0ABD3F5D5_9STRA